MADVACRMHHSVRLGSGSARTLLSLPPLLPQWPERVPQWRPPTICGPSHCIKYALVTEFVVPMDGRYYNKCEVESVHLTTTSPSVVSEECDQRGISCNGTAQVLEIATKTPTTCLTRIPILSGVGGGRALDLLILVPCDDRKGCTGQSWQTAEPGSGATCSQPGGRQGLFELAGGGRWPRGLHGGTE